MPTIEEVLLKTMEEYYKVKVQRDELAAAARDLLGVIDAHNRPASCSYDFYYSSGSLRAALAKLEDGVTSGGNHGK